MDARPLPDVELATFGLGPCVKLWVKLKIPEGSFRLVVVHANHAAVEAEFEVMRPDDFGETSEGAVCHEGIAAVALAAEFQVARWIEGWEHGEAAGGVHVRQEAQLARCKA